MSAQDSGDSIRKISRILSIDIGGSHLKSAIVDRKGNLLTDRVRTPTPKGAAPGEIVEAITRLVRPLGSYDSIGVGFPGYVRKGKVFTAPNLGNEQWHGYELADAIQWHLRKPVRLANDADVQGLAAIEGKGLELVCTLGTGFGTGWYHDGILMPHLELAHLRVRGKKDLDAYLGEHARRKAGDKKWNKRVEKIIGVLSGVFNFDRLYLGGGNAEKLSFTLPANAKIIPNMDGLRGGAYLWRLPSTTL